MSRVKKDRGTKITKTIVAGKGGDGEDWGVSSLVSKRGGKEAYRRQVCSECPWRKDSPIGRFPPDAYRASAATCYDASMRTFACHESGSTNPQTCAGFLKANSGHNIMIRIAGMENILPHVKGEPELYESYHHMAIANGVPEDDPVIAPCRGDRENGMDVADRVRATWKPGMKKPYDHDD